MSTSAPIQLGSEQHTYEWLDNWAQIPDTESGRSNGRTHGVACCRTTGEVVVFNQADPALLFFDEQGRLARSWGDRFGGAHGLTLVEEGGEEFLWLTDQNTAEVVKTTLQGETVMTLTKPEHARYAEEKARYSPTWVAVNPGNGDIWVADGYGKNLVHRFAADGTQLGSIDGSEEGALGPFKCPHGIAFDSRSGAPELYITDRGNARLQIYDAEGRFLRGVEKVFHSPCCFDFQGELMLVPELSAGVKLCRGDGEVVANLGDNRAVTEVKGWPNLAGTEHVKPGLFNSPHGGCFGPDGSIYVVEWIVGGRITRLRPV